MTPANRIKSASTIMRVRMLAMLVVVAAGGSRAGAERRRLRQRRSDHGDRHRAAQQIHRADRSEAGAPPGGAGPADRRDPEGSRGQALGHRSQQCGGRRQLLQDGAPHGPIRRAIDPDSSRRKASTPARSNRRIRADIVWQQLIRGRYQSRLQLTDQEILQALEAKKPEERDAVGYEYLLRPILFLVPPGARRATYDGRKREAEALRKTFKGCTESIPAVRAMRDVAVRDQVIRSSADLPENLRKVLDSVPLGELTAARSHAARHRDVCGLLQRTRPRPIRPAARRRARTSDQDASKRNPRSICGSCARTR